MKNDAFSTYHTQNTHTHRAHTNHKHVWIVISAQPAPKLKFNYNGRFSRINSIRPSFSLVPYSVQHVLFCVNEIRAQFRNLDRRFVNDHQCSSKQSDIAEESKRQPRWNIEFQPFFFYLAVCDVNPCIIPMVFCSARIFLSGFSNEWNARPSIEEKTQ